VEEVLFQDLVFLRYPSADPRYGECIIVVLTLFLYGGGCGETRSCRDLRLKKVSLSGL
jgi:hypothetical protein